MRILCLATLRNTLDEMVTVLQYRKQDPSARSKFPSPVIGSFSVTTSASTVLRAAFFVFLDCQDLRWLDGPMCPVVVNDLEGRVQRGCRTQYPSFVILPGRVFPILRLPVIYDMKVQIFLILVPSYIWTMFFLLRLAVIINGTSYVEALRRLRRSNSTDFNVDRCSVTNVHLSLFFPHRDHERMESFLKCFPFSPLFFNIFSPNDDLFQDSGHWHRPCCTHGCNSISIARFERRTGRNCQNLSFSFSASCW